MGRGELSAEAAKGPAKGTPRMVTHDPGARTQKDITNIGYTDHLGGMYADKFIHKNIQCEAGRYITIGDKYVDKAVVLPARWKEKQFEAPQFPMNAGDGFFGHGGKPFLYMPDAYVEQLPYNKTQPQDKRKLGFGTKDAFKADEFTQRIRTEQYRDLLKREQRLMKASDARSVEEMRRIVKAKEAEDANRQFVHGKKEIEHLYDVGRNINTAHNPRVPRDQFFTMDEATRMPRRMGAYRTMAQDIGEGHWAVKLQPPGHGQNHVMANTFYDRSHLNGGMPNAETRRYGFDD